MASNRKKKELQRQLMEKYNISFDGPVDSVETPRWSNNCDAIFEDIQRLGKTSYLEYQESVSADARRHPWRLKVQRRAKLVADTAKRCLEARKNEAGWRLNIEHRVMARFSVEVACRKCRGRLWRSEQEAVSHSQQPYDEANSLEARQRRRRPCVCNDGSCSDDALEAGLNALFDDKADEAIVYSPELQSELPKREDRPDRVYGLRQTKRLERLLNSQSSLSNSMLNDDIKSSPFRPDGKPVVFPFLVLEAKSEKGADSFTDAQIQTAFVIRELLSIQDSLAEASAEDETWDGGPLVWFLSYRGENWRVFAAYVETQGTEKFYHVVRLWEGSIDSHSSALQLLLIVDYIVDWARDVYRGGVTESLRRLAPEDSASLANDSDIFSLNHNIRSWAETGGNEMSTNIVSPSRSSTDTFRAFDSIYGVFRNGNLINTRFLGVCIHEDNFEQLINSAPTQQESVNLAKSLVGALEESYRVRYEMLDELELSWANEVPHPNMIPPDKIFFVVVTVSWYMSVEWELTRELSYLAVAESLKEKVHAAALMKMYINKFLSQVPVVKEMPPFEKLSKLSAPHNLSLCASRISLSINYMHSRQREAKQHFIWQTVSVEETPRDKKSHQKFVVSTRQISKARDLVYALYLRHRIGRNEPSSSLFRVHSRVDEVELSNDCYEPSAIRNSWPWARDDMNLLKQKLILATSPDKTVSYKGLVCIYVMNPWVASVKERESQTAISSSCLRVKKYHHKSPWDGRWTLTSFSKSDPFYGRILTKFVRYLETAKYWPVGSEDHQNYIDPGRTMRGEIKWKVLMEQSIVSGKSILDMIEHAMRNSTRNRDNEDVDSPYQKKRKREIPDIGDAFEPKRIMFSTAELEVLSSRPVIHSPV